MSRIEKGESRHPSPERDRASECYPVDELGRLAELPPDHPDRAHAAECPRCRARLASFESFLAADAECPPAQLDEALTRLQLGLDREIFGAAGSARATVTPFRPAVVRVAIAIAAVLLLLVAADSLRRDDSERKIVLRTDNPVAADPFAGSVSADVTPEGVRLSWPAHAGADAYAVRLMDAELTEVALIEVAGALELTLDAPLLRERFPDAPVFAWSVVALSEGDPIGESRPAACRFGAGP